MKRSVRSAAHALGAGLLVVSSLVAQPTAANVTPVVLPDFSVYGERELPAPEAWLYTRIDGFEVLSNASTRRTRDMATELQRYAYALGLVWPGARVPANAPAALVICGAGRKFEEFLPTDLARAERAFTTFHRRTRDFSALVVDAQTRSLNLALVDAPATTTAAAASESPGGATSAETTEAGVDTGFQIDPQQQLLRSYVHYVLASLEPAPAPWLAEGLAQLCSGLRITETEISLGRIENPNEVTAARTDRDFNAALARRALMPMDELFAVQPDSVTARSPLDSRWAKQCYAFVHWGLYGDLGRNQQAFIRFLVRSGTEGTSEKLFRECFQRSYADMLLTLRTHVEHTRAKVAGVRAGAGEKIPWPPAVEVRPANETEIARLKAEVFTLSGHADRARDALVLAYRRGERSPGLLAALGTAEFQTGQRDRARKFLEAAAKAGARDPRASWTLARLRLDERLAQPQAPGGRLSQEQLLGVLEPLLLARTQPPARPETYELFAAAWESCATPPPPAHLAVLEEGLQLFPQLTAVRAARARLATPSPTQP